MNKRDLQIEFRAVPYSTISHALEYRILPDQDRTYYKELSILGLFKIKVKKQYSTNWVQPLRFLNYPSAYQYPKDENYMPFIIRCPYEFSMFKTSFKTYGEFEDYINQIDAKEIAEWEAERNEYLKKRNIWH